LCLCRLSISPRGDRRGGTPAGGRRGTPLRAAKRRRYDEESIETAAEYDTNSVANGDVEILEDDPEGKFIRLHNKGDKVFGLFYVIFIKFMLAIMIDIYGL